MIVDFKRAGGIHVCHLAGHEYSNMIGYTESGIFTVVVECATSKRTLCYDYENKKVVWNG